MVYKDPRIKGPYSGPIIPALGCKPYTLNAKPYKPPAQVKLELEELKPRMLGVGLDSTEEIRGGCEIRGWMVQGLRVSHLRLKGQGLGFRGSGVKFWVQRFGCRVEGFRVYRGRFSAQNRDNILGPLNRKPRTLAWRGV